MDKYADADEQEAAGDPAIDYERLEEVATLFAENAPLDALTALYGEKLDVPA